MRLLILILIWPILRCESLTKRITKEPIVCVVWHERLQWSKRTKYQIKCQTMYWTHLIKERKSNTTQRWNKKSKQVNKSWRRSAPKKRLKKKIQKENELSEWLYLIRRLFVQRLKYKISPDLREIHLKRKQSNGKESEEKRYNSIFFRLTTRYTHSILMYACACVWILNEQKEHTKGPFRIGAVIEWVNIVCVYYMCTIHIKIRFLSISIQYLLFWFRLQNQNVL